MIQISETAARQIRTLMAKQGLEEGGLRVGVKGGGCGVTLIIGFDKKKESDHYYVVEGIPVYVDKKHTMYLIGKEVDFYDGEDGRGFTFVDVVR